MTRLQRLPLFAMLALVALILLGGALRMLGAEQACAGAWPRCNGDWLPPLALAPILDYVHGLLAVLVPVLTLAGAVLVQRATNSSTRSRIVAWTAVGLLVADRLAYLLLANAGWPTAALVAGQVFVMLTLAVLAALCWSLADDHGAPAWLAGAGRARGVVPDRMLVTLARLGVVVMLILIASGTLTGSSSGPLPCTSWPLCEDGTLVPEQPTVEGWLHVAHRGLAAFGAILVFAIALRAWTRPAGVLTRRLALASAGLVIVQVLLGGDFVVSGAPAALGMLHLVAGLGLWLLVVALAILTPLAGSVRLVPSAVDTTGSVLDPSPVMRMTAAPATDAAAALSPVHGALDLGLPNVRAWRALVSDYVALTKPGIMSLLLFTTFTAMLIAAAGLPPFGLILVTIVGGVLASGGANVLNCYIDHDIDAQMSRTRHRATAANRIPLQHVLIFGLSLTVLSFLLIGFGANWVAALLALAGNVYYVLIYTTWLKRRTPQNIVIGGGAGAVPPLVGWAAVTGDLSIMAWMLFAIIFMWTPPHFWSLALLKQGEYGRALVPMLPVVAGEAVTRRQILMYSTLLFLVCLALVPLGLGPIYLVSAIAINAVFWGLSLLLFLRPSKRHARRLFFWSLWYLALIFLAAVIDRLLLG